MSGEVDTIVLQPGESTLLDMPFANILRSGDTLTGTPTVTQELIDEATGARSSTSNLTIGTPSLSTDSLTVQVRIGATVGSPNGVTDGELYLVTIVAQTTGGDTREAEGRIRIRDIG